VIKSERRKLSSGWQLEKVYDLLELKYGKGLPKIIRKDGSVPVYGSNGLVGYHSESITNGQSIIVGRKGSAGEVLLSDIACWPIDTTYFIDEFKRDCDFKYVFYALKNLNLANLDKSSAVPGLNRDDVYKLHIPIPSKLKDQTAIAQKIENNVSVIEKMRQEALRQKEAALAMRGAILRDVFTTNGKKDSWRTVKIAKIARINMGQSPDGSTYNKEGYGTPLLNGPTEFGAEHPTPVQWTTLPKKICQKGDLILCVRGNTTGRMNKADQEYCLGRGVAGIRGRERKGNTDFLAFVLQFKIGLLLVGSERSTFPNLGRDELNSFEILAPEDVTEQRKAAKGIKDKLNWSNGTLNKINSQLEAIQALPAAILREVFDFQEANA